MKNAQKKLAFVVFLLLYNKLLISTRLNCVPGWTVTNKPTTLLK